MLYARRFLNYLSGGDHELYLTISPAGFIVLEQELKVRLKGKTRSDITEILGREFQLAGNFKYLDHNDFHSCAASGTGGMKAMVIIPCSMGTLARIAQGISGNLIERAADVALKERSPLILVPRETPLNQIHLRNMLILSKAGASIVPAMPAFYGRSGKVSDLVDFLVGKVLDQLGIKHDLFELWG